MNWNMLVTVCAFGSCLLAKADASDIGIHAPSEQIISNEPISLLAGRLTRNYGVPVSIELDGKDSRRLVTLESCVASSNVAENIRAALTPLDHYVVKEDRTTGMINIIPRDESRLNWNLPYINILDQTIKDVFEKDMLQMKKHGIHFFQDSGNLSWLDTRITVTNHCNMTAISALNLLCRAMPWNTRWEAKGVHKKEISILSFYFFDSRLADSETGERR